jgi:hypothetical protein
VASPNGAGNNYLVSMSAVSANDIWAVGNSTNAGGFDRALAEHWNGNTWTVVATPDPGAYHDDLSGVKAISTNDVWAVGAYTVDAAGTMANSYASHWNGTSWNWFLLPPYPSNQFSFLSAVTASSSNDVWAVGTYYSAGFLPWADHWNGATWTPILLSNYPSPSDNELFAVSAFSSTDVWAVGEWSGNGGGATPLQSLAYHFDGTTWNLVATPNLGTGADNEIVGVKALEAGHAVGVGYGNFVSGSATRQNEAWDLLATGASTSTTPVTTGLGTGDNALLDVARSGGGVWAVGYSRPSAAAPRQTLVIPATWDAAGHTATWGSAAGISDNPGSVNSVLEAVAAASPYAFSASGYQNSGGADQTLTEAYCANHFNLTAPPNPTAGSAFSLTATVQDGNGTVVTTYRGTVHFTSSDNSAVLPANYTFTPSDNGTHIFAGVVLNTSGNQTITAADTAMPLTTPGSAMIDVACRGACPAPVGTPGARAATAGPSGIPSGRAGASQSGAAPGHPRLPRLGAQSQAAETGPGAAVTAAVASAPQAMAAPAAAQALVAGRVAAPDHHVSTISLHSLAVQPREPAVMTRTPVTTATLQPGVNREWLALALVPLAAVAIALLWGRRRNNRRLNG